MCVQRTCVCVRIFEGGVFSASGESESRIMIIFFSLDVLAR